MSLRMTFVDIPTATCRNTTVVQSSLPPQLSQMQQQKREEEEGGRALVSAVTSALHLRPKEGKAVALGRPKSFSAVQPTRKGTAAVKRLGRAPRGALPSSHSSSSSISSGCSNTKKTTADRKGCAGGRAMVLTAEMCGGTCIPLPVWHRKDVLDCTNRQLATPPCLHHPLTKLDHGSGSRSVRQVRMLRLSRNSLTSLEKPTGLPAAVQPIGLAAFTCVVLLDVSRNQVASLAGVEAMPSLRVLCASRNRLVDLAPLFGPSSVLQRRSALQVLDVSFNCIRSITHSGADDGDEVPLHCLRRLVLSYNHLTHLNGVDVLFPNVEELLVVRNQLTAAPLSLPRRLRCLEMPQNFLDDTAQRDIKDLSRKMRYLQKVDVSKQRIRLSDAAEDGARRDGDKSSECELHAKCDVDLDPDNGADGSGMFGRTTDARHSDRGGSDDTQLDMMSTVTAEEEEKSFWDGNNQGNDPECEQIVDVPSRIADTFTALSSRSRDRSDNVAFFHPLPHGTDDVVEAPQAKLVECLVNQLNVKNHWCGGGSSSSQCHPASPKPPSPSPSPLPLQVKEERLAGAGALHTSTSSPAVRCQPRLCGACVWERRIVELQAPLTWMDVRKWHTVYNCCALRRTMQWRIDRRHRISTIHDDGDAAARDDVGSGGTSSAFSVRDASDAPVSCVTLR